MIKPCFSPPPSSRRSSRSVQLLFLLLLSSTALSAGAAGDGPGARGFFGLTPVPTDQGLAVKAVTPGSPAERAGIVAGDRLLSLSGKPVADLPQSEIHDIFTGFHVGDSVEVVYRRPGVGISTVRLDLVSVPPLKLQEQRRIEQIDREIRASEVVKRILNTSDEFELARSESGGIRYRPDAETPWETLDGDVGDQLDPLMKILPENQRQSRFRIERREDGSIDRIVPIRQSRQPGE